MDRERHDIGLPERAEPEPIGAVRYGGSEYRVSVHEGEHGPLIDVREYVLPRRPEETRAYVPKGKGRGRGNREPFVGYTKRGVRMQYESMMSLASLILQAGTIAEEQVAAEQREAV